MKRKIKYLSTILLFVFLFYTIKSSYSRYSTEAEGQLDAENISFAKFVVNNQLRDTLNFDIKDMSPNTLKTFNFSVSNTRSGTNSDVSIVYKIYVESYILPLEYKLTQNSSTNNILNCNSNVGVTCQTPNITLSYSQNTVNNYTLTVEFPEKNPSDTAWNPIYMGNIDKVNLRIESWQKTS